MRHPGGRMVRVTARALEAARVHAFRTFPEECCGALLGRDTDGLRIVERIVEVENRASDARERRYLIPAPVIRELESRAAEEGLSVIGFYHSHPDGVALPSSEDREWAWPWYSYLIVPVEGRESDGSARLAARCWRLRDDREAFEEEQVIVMRQGSEVGCRGSE